MSAGGDTTIMPCLSWSKDYKVKSLSMGPQIGRLGAILCFGPQNIDKTTSLTIRDFLTLALRLSLDQAQQPKSSRNTIAT